MPYAAPLSKPASFTLKRMIPFEVLSTPLKDKPMITYKIKFHALCKPQAIHRPDRRKTSMEKTMEMRYKFMIPTMAYAKSASSKLIKCGRTNALKLIITAFGMDIFSNNECSKNPLHIISSAAPCIPNAKIHKKRLSKSTLAFHSRNIMEPLMQLIPIIIPESVSLAANYFHNAT